MHHDLTNPEYVQQLLATHGITPERASGQNFLVCEEPIAALITAMEGAGECVTELGAGAGAATAALVASKFRVRAIERDEQLATLLPEVVPKHEAGMFDLRVADLRDVDWQWEEPWQLVGNIPYNLSGYIVRRLTELDRPPTQALFMVQREVAERLTAEAPHMNLLGLAAQLWGSTHLLLQVPRTCFFPEPAVDSSLVLLVPHAAAGISHEEREKILGLAKLFFQQKRKQMGGVGKRVLAAPPETVLAALAAANVSPSARPQEVSPAQWRILARELVY